MLTLLETRLGGYTDVYTAMERRFATLLQKQCADVETRCEEK